MSQLNNYQPEATFGDILTTTPPSVGSGLNNVLAQLQDGLGNPSTITIATNAVNFNRQGGNTFQLDGVPLTAGATNLNQISSANPVIPGFQGMKLPSGTTAQRPGAPTAGTIRFNSTTSSFEGWNGIAWVIF